jgi:hypothetical protein
VRGALALVLAVLAAVGLTGCQSGQGEGENAPMGVEVGKAFEWDGFKVSDGWKLSSQDVDRGGETVKQPNLTMTVTNDGSKRRSVLLQVAFLQADQLLAAVNCSSDPLDPGQAEDITCKGLRATYPSGYDDVQVQTVRHG